VIHDSTPRFALAAALAPHTQQRASSGTAKHGWPTLVAGRFAAVDHILEEQ